MTNENNGRVVSKQTVLRLPHYLNYLNGIDVKENTYISAPTIAHDMHLNDIQVRKDLAVISSKKGNPKIGFEIERLISDIKEFLGYNNVKDAVIVGTGHLGKALIFYDGFTEYGLHIVAAFDIANVDFVGKVRVFPLDRMSNLVKRLHIHIGIITVPAPHAQEVCNMLVESGIKAIWNFAPVHLKVPDGIIVQNENMAISLAMLSKKLETNESDE